MGVCAKSLNWVEKLWEANEMRPESMCWKLYDSGMWFIFVAV